eukprot:5880784-Prymnesium_polylepis.2
MPPFCDAATCDGTLSNGTTCDGSTCDGTHVRWHQCAAREVGVTRTTRRALRNGRAPCAMGLPRVATSNEDGPCHAARAVPRHAPCTIGAWPCHVGLHRAKTTLDCLIAWLPDCLAFHRATTTLNFPITQLPDCPITRLPDCPITRLPNYPIARLPDCVASHRATTTSRQQRMRRWRSHTRTTLWRWRTSGGSCELLDGLIARFADCSIAQLQWWIRRPAGVSDCLPDCSGGLGALLDLSILMA